MPIKTVLVADVQTRLVRNGVKRYEVFARQDGDSWSVSYSTLDPWKATFCQQAMKLRKPITIGTRETVYGPEIVTVEFAEGAA